MYSTFFRLSGLGQESAKWGENRFFVFSERLHPKLLEDALERVGSTSLPIIKGRIICEPSSGLYWGVENNAGFEFKYDVVHDEELSAVLASSQGEAAMSDSRFKEFFPPLFPGVGWSNPIVLVRVTVFEPAGFSLLAFTLPHGVFDASSTLAFVKLWDAACASSSGMDRVGGEARHAERYPVRFPRPGLMAEKALLSRFDPDFIDSKLALGAAQEMVTTLTLLQATHRFRRFIVRGEPLERLKNKVNAALSSDSRVSTNELLFAMGLFSTHLAEVAKGNETFQPGKEVDWTFCVVTDMRERTDMFPGQSYIGNAFARRVFTVKAPTPHRDDDIFTGIVNYSRFVHQEIRKAIGNRAAMEDQFALGELQHLRPDLIDSVFNYRRIHLIRSNGHDMNSWKRFSSYFDITLGGASRPIYMNNTPLYGDFCLPRMYLVIPTRPDGTVDIRSHLTPAENDQLETLCTHFGLFG